MSAHDKVLKDLQQRKEVGEKRYGANSLGADNGRDNLKDAYEEALDLVVYLRNELDSRQDSVVSANGYQRRTYRTALYPLAGEGSPGGIIYCTLGLAGEAAEIANKIKKQVRGDYIVGRDDIKKELGDVLWYVSNLAREYNLDLSDIMDANIRKLEDRQKRGKLQGDGDNR